MTGATPATFGRSVRAAASSARNVLTGCAVLQPAIEFVQDALGGILLPPKAFTGWNLEAGMTTMFDRILRDAKRAQVLAQYSADTEMFLNNAIIDEVSVLFRTAAELEAFLEWAVECKGLTHFNGVTDECRSRALPRGDAHRYTVRLEFLRLPGVDWRIEAMVILDGTAPLHSQHLNDHGSGCIIHASFKAKDLGFYLQYRDTLEAMDSLCGPIPLRAEYENSYGRYAYYGDHQPETSWYIKPRVNLRDA